MDDIVILARTRWHLRSEMKTLYQVIQPLGLKMHSLKEFFTGLIEEEFDFLGIA